MKIPTFAGGRIFRNRTNIKTAWLIQHTALFTEIRPIKDRFGVCFFSRNTLCDCIYKGF